MIYVTAASIDMYNMPLFIGHMWKLIQYRGIKLYSYPSEESRRDLEELLVIK